MNLKPLLLFILIVTSAYAQQTHLKGAVIDTKTNEQIPDATIGLLNKNLFYKADKNGKFDIESKVTPTDTISFLCIGYKTFKVPFQQWPNDGIIKLSELNTTLSEVKN